MKSWKIAIFIVATGLLLPTVPRAEEEKATEGDSELPKSIYRELDLFTKVLHHIVNDYVEKVDPKELIHGAINGMLSGIDPHSAFMPPEVYEELKVDTEGRFSGVGLEITIKEKALTVVTPIEGSPADRAGVREGDRILKIDGTSTKGMELTTAVEKMRGPRKSRVTLTLQRSGRAEPFDVRLSRETIRVKSVRAEEPEPGYGYLRITAFQQGTARELERSLSRLEEKSRPEGGLKGLILDVRNNPGGLLDEAIEVADKFLSEGVIVTTLSRNKEIDKREATADGTHPNFPMIVLVNGGSASASEIVAGALQDHDRAVVLGTETFGKGSVQTIFELGHNHALKLTVARYYTPSGRSIQAEGIEPDIIVREDERPETVELRPKIVREKDLPRHLGGDKKGAPLSAPGESDVQKQVALDTLKSWHIFRK